MFAEACFTPKVKLQLTQLVTAYHMANNAFGATFISDRLVRTENAHLRFYLLDSPLATRLFHILLPERDYTPFAVRRSSAFPCRRSATPILPMAATGDCRSEHPPRSLKYFSKRPQNFKPTLRMI